MNIITPVQIRSISKRLAERMASRNPDTETFDFNRRSLTPDQWHDCEETLIDSHAIWRIEAQDHDVEGIVEFREVPPLPARYGTEAIRYALDILHREMGYLEGLPDPGKTFTAMTCAKCGSDEIHHDAYLRAEPMLGLVECVTTFSKGNICTACDSELKYRDIRSKAVTFSSHQAMGFQREIRAALEAIREARRIIIDIAAAADMDGSRIDREIFG